MVSKLVWVVYPVCSVVVLLFGLFACTFMFIRQRRNQIKDTTEFFLTARRSTVRTLLHLGAVCFPMQRLLSAISKAWTSGSLTEGIRQQSKSTDLPTVMQGWFRIGWSFFAAAMGSWTLFSPASYGYYAGTLGLAMYAISSGEAAASHVTLPLKMSGRVSQAVWQTASCDATVMANCVL